jgi:hypothetical protein
VASFFPNPNCMASFFSSPSPQSHKHSRGSSSFDLQHVGADERQQGEGHKGRGGRSSARLAIETRGGDTTHRARYAAALRQVLGHGCHGCGTAARREQDMRSAARAEEMTRGQGDRGHGR